MKLVIAEKNELARDIASAMCGLDGKPSDIKLPARGNGYVVCAASGHLLALKEPGDVDEAYARTEIEDLPISLDPWPVAPQGEYQQKKLDSIAELVGECDGEIFHAGDADDEGQLIVDEILEWCGVPPDDARVKRVYVNDNIAKNIRAAFAAAKPNAECAKDGWAAKARSLGDFCFGINESRLASGKLKARVSVGRVQTPTLGLVVQRDLEREGHVKREYYGLVLDTRERGGNGARAMFKYKPPESSLEDGKHCFDAALLEGVASRLEADGARPISATVEVERKTIASPLPYNFTDLAADMGKRFKMTAEDVMNATQTLRDTYKAITYNRAESRHLPEGHLASAPAVTAIVSENIGWQGPIDLSMGHEAFDDGKTGVHHGIIPQETKVDVAALPERERKVYEAIAARYLALFAPPLQYEAASASLDAKAVAGLKDIGGRFEYKGNRVIDEGWAKFCPPTWLNLRNRADGVPAGGRGAFDVESCEIKAKETAPPPAFTDGTLMVAMSNIARYVKDPEVKRILQEKDAASTTDHGSIGTVATRKDIIERLVEHGFLAREKDKLVSTAKARKFYELVPEEIRGADLTARWYLIQKQVSEGKAPIAAVMESVCEEFAKHRDTAYEGMTLRPTFGKCPKCGEPVEKRGTIFACTTVKTERDAEGNWNDVAGCGFKLLGFGGRKFTEKQAAALLSGKTVSLKGCVSKNTGKKYDCKVKIGASGEIEPIFESAGKGGGYVNKPRGRGRRF